MVVVNETQPETIPSMVKSGVLKASTFAFIMNIRPCVKEPSKSTVIVPDKEISKDRRKGEVLASHIFVK